MSSSSSPTRRILVIWVIVTLANGTSARTTAASRRSFCAKTWGNAGIPRPIFPPRCKSSRSLDATGITLYQANLRTYQLLRYGAQVQIATGKPNETVHFIDWEKPEKNDFALAEEVTLKGGYERRPDIVLYLNGIAIAVIELKRGSVEIADGVRQLITNQEPIFNLGFFSRRSFFSPATIPRGCATAPPPRRRSFLWNGSRRMSPR